jgi:hypothetical protein
MVERVTGHEGGAGERRPTERSAAGAADKSERMTVSNDRHAVIRASGRIAATAGFGLALAGCIMTNGQESFDDGLAVQQDDQPVIHRLLTGTLIDPPRAQIEYTARSPLVVPPSADLPPPEAKGEIVQKAGQWPNDPDVAAKAAKAQNTGPTASERLYESMRGTPRLTAQEIQEGRMAGGGLRETPSDYNQSSSTNQNRLADRLTPEQLAQKINTPSGDRVEINANPTRRYLIEPPADYRKPASTAEMPEVKASAPDAASVWYDPKQSVRDNPAITGQ